MAISKVNFGSDVLIDLTGDTVDAEHLSEGYTAHDKTGAPIIGTMISGGESSGGDYNVTTVNNSDGTQTINITDAVPGMQSIKFNGHLLFLSYIFSNMTDLTDVDLSSIDTSKVEDMSGLFTGCTSVTSLDLTYLDTSNVIYFSEMFSGCTKLTSLDISSWDTSNSDPQDGMSKMFDDCTNLTNLNSCPFYYSINFYGSDKLTHDSLMSIINNLGTVSSSQTLTIGNTNLAKLTSDEIAVATNKGWTVA